MTKSLYSNYGPTMDDMNLHKKNKSITPKKNNFKRKELAAKMKY